jgi:hypothetical protein
MTPNLLRITRMILGRQARLSGGMKQTGTMCTLLPRILLDELTNGAIRCHAATWEILTSLFEGFCLRHNGIP